MAIWLRSPHIGVDYPKGSSAELRALHVGAASEIVRAKEFAALVSIDEAFEALDIQRDALLNEAREEAMQIIAQAERDAAQQIVQAQARYEDASAQGYRDGNERALAEWHERLANARHSQGELQARLRERFAGIVAAAVERIVRIEQRDRLFERALSEVDQIADNAAYLKVIVRPEDLEHAQTAFGQLAARWRELGQPFPLYVSADARLGIGSCVCESDLGTVDASIDTQLGAMRNAMSRVLERAACAPEAVHAQDAHEDVRESEPAFE